METAAYLFTAITCLLHGYFFILETFLWTTPYGMKVFGMTPERAKSSANLAANQGVYNGMLAIGLILSFFLTEPASSFAIRAYCLFFIIVVGTYGWYRLNNVKIFLFQALPALLALLLLFSSVIKF